MISLLIPTSSEPVSLTDVKSYLRITHTSEDALLSALITAARQLVEGYISRSLITQTFMYTAKQFNDPMRLTANLQAVQTVKYYDSNNIQQELSVDSYFVLPQYVVGEIHLNYGGGYSYPETYPRPDAVQVQFTAGYGAAENVPKPLWQAILLLIGHFYENREASTPLSMKQLPLIGNQDTVSALLSTYVIPVVA